MKAARELVRSGEGRLPGRLHLERRGPGHLRVRKGRQDPLLRHPLPDLAADLGRRPPVHRPHHQQREPVRAGAGQEGVDLPYKKWAHISPDYEYGHNVWEEFIAYLKKLKPDVAGRPAELAEARRDRPQLLRHRAAPVRRRGVLQLGVGRAGDRVREAGAALRPLRQDPARRASVGNPDELDPLGKEAPVGAIARRASPGTTTGMQKRHPKLAEWVKKYEARAKKEPHARRLLGLRERLHHRGGHQAGEEHRHRQGHRGAERRATRWTSRGARSIMRGCDSRRIPPQWIGVVKMNAQGKPVAARHRGDARQGRHQELRRGRRSSGRPRGREEEVAACGLHYQPVPLDHQRSAHHRAGDERALSVGMFLFLVSVGMSLIFGVTRIVNLAHGSFYMVGAYLMVTLVEIAARDQAWTFWVALLAGAARRRPLLGGVIEIGPPPPASITAIRSCSSSSPSGSSWSSARSSCSRGGPTTRACRARTRWPARCEIFGQPFPSYYLLVLGLAPLVAVGALARLLPHALGHADPRGHRRPRDAGRARRQRGHPLHAGVHLRELAGRPRRRARGADGGGGARHGRRRADHRVRGGRHRRARAASPGASSARSWSATAPVLRDPHLPGGLDRAALRDHGRRPDRAARGASSGGRRSSR